MTDNIVKAHIVKEEGKLYVLKFAVASFNDTSVTTKVQPLTVTEIKEEGWCGFDTGLFDHAPAIESPGKVLPGCTRLQRATSIVEDME